MRGKNKIIIGGIVLIFLIIIMGLNFLVPSLKLELNGDKEIELEFSTPYQELGAHAYIKSPFKTQNLDVKISGQVDTTILGKYIITYSASYKKSKIEVKRTINVVDKTKPVITLKKEVKACQKNKSIDIEAEVIDNYDGDISDRLKYNVEVNKVHLMASDSSGNLAEIFEDIKYIDDEKPKITLNGDKEIILALGDEYIEEGAKASDSCDGDLTNKIEIKSDINLAKIGEYQVNYQVKDQNGNDVMVTRKVKIVAKDNNSEKVENGVIYLTFDDGPGQYTQAILDILAENNIKATFFVTNQFPKYQSMIKKEYEAGHTVGIHTYSHKWDIYDSVDIYLEDFNKIEQIVFTQTGVHPKYFRFPGGSSNTISIKHCKGIMTNLAKIMSERGYVYFDWTFDSGDTYKKNNTTNDIINNVKKGLKSNSANIILMHDIKKNTLMALPSIIKYAKEKGYIFKAIDEETPLKQFKIVN